MLSGRDVLNKEMKLLKSIVKRVLAYDSRPGVRRAVDKWRHFGFTRYCPCCKAHLRRFSPCGLIPRLEAKCPLCGSLERHRLICLYVTRKTNLFDARRKKMLHVAPEPQLSHLFRKANSVDYLSADLFAPNAMVKMDITDIQYPDNTFDVIYCSHVLEHVSEDRRAMREFCRVLKPRGWAILQVPIQGNTTFEDPTVVNPQERQRLFGQYDHVRQYGLDYKERLVNAGFSVKVDDFVRELNDHTICRLGLMRKEDVYFCRKEAV
jgi:SAM-dependent methyltransferase